MFESQIVNYIVFAVLSYIETYILWFFFRVFLNQNTQRERHIWAGKMVYFVFQCLTYVLYFPLFSSAIPTYLLAIVITLIFFDDELSFKALTVHIFVFLSYSCRTFALAGTLSLFRVFRASWPCSPLGRFGGCNRCGAKGIPWCMKACSAWRRPFS